jgi:hypothetical protein
VRSDVTASQVQQAMVELGSTGACGSGPAIRVALSLTQVIHFFKSDCAVRLVFIIQGALGAQTAPSLEHGENLVTSALYFVYDYPPLRDKSLSLKDRDTLIRAQYAAGVSQAELARQFGISYQRVHQIVRGETR